MKNIHGLLLAGCSALALAGCGPSDIASPGTGGNIIINNPAPTPTPSPTPTSGGTVTAASACPSISSTKQLTDGGVLSGPTGTWRVCTLPAIIDRSVQLPKVTGLVYQMNGRVDVGCDGGYSAPSAGTPVASSTVGCTAANGFTLNGAGQLTADTNVTLTIDPGVIVIGAPGASWLAVNRGNKINAVGTVASPVIFTSRDNVTGQVTETSQGQWGGVVLMGRAPVTDCTTGTLATQCERQTEGATDPARFGGANSAYDAGKMSYVQIRYSGFILSSNIELQSLTGEGVGTATQLDHIMSYNSSDDGSEWFGGSPNLKYYVSVGADDDTLDVDTGAQMNVQYALLLQRDGQGDALFEIDSANGLEADTPRTKLNVANFTAIQKLSVPNNNEVNDQAAALFRGNSDTTLVNGIIYTPNNECIRLAGTSVSGSAVATLVARSVVLSCNSTKYLSTGTGTNAATSFGTGSNNNNDAFTSTLASLFINGTNETGVTATDPKGFSTFFDTTTWIGAVRNSTDTWYAGWTCNSAAANLGATNGSCTSLSTT